MTDEVRVGLTPKEVEALLGSPDKVLTVSAGVHTGTEWIFLSYGHYFAPILSHGANFVSGHGPIGRVIFIDGKVAQVKLSEK